MTGLRHRLLSFVDSRLDRLFTRPRMWGSNEAVEFQALLLIELRALVLRPEEDQRRLFTLLQGAYHRFIEEKCPGESPQFLASLAPGNLVPLLQEFRNTWEPATTGDNPFETYDLVLQLNLRSGVDSPPTSVGSRRIIRRGS